MGARTSKVATANQRNQINPKRTSLVDKGTNQIILFENHIILTYYIIYKYPS